MKYLLIILILFGSAHAQDTIGYTLLPFYSMKFSGPATEEVLINDSIRGTPVILVYRKLKRPNDTAYFNFKSRIK